MGLENKKFPPVSKYNKCHSPYKTCTEQTSQIMEAISYLNNTNDTAFDVIYFHTLYTNYTYKTYHIIKSLVICCFIWTQIRWHIFRYYKRSIIDHFKGKNIRDYKHSIYKSRIIFWILDTWLDVTIMPLSSTNSGKSWSLESSPTKIKKWKLQTRFYWACSWEIIKCATSLMPPTTGVFTSQY